MAESGRSKRATMLDVAAAAGVSYQTVSRVINDHPNVKAETRARVLEVIAQLNYRPDRAARSLAARESRTLALISYGIEYYGPLQMVVNIEHSAREAGYDLISANVDLRLHGSIRPVLDRLFAWRVDGVLMIASVVSRGTEKLIKQMSDTPLLQIDNAPGASTPSMIVDQRAGGYAAAHHLTELGHRDFALISGPLDWFGSASRREGWLSALREVGLEPVAAATGDWSAASGYAAAAELLDSGARFSALLVGNDSMALGAICALKSRGLGVPEQVSVVGFDDVPEAAYFDPPLTTVWQDFPELGRQGLAYLVELIQNPDSADGQRVIAPRLVVRSSTQKHMPI